MSDHSTEYPHVPHTRSQLAHKIDSLMEHASRALVERRYFDAERMALDALNRAFGILDYERMARIVLPLEEARRQKRDMAVDAGAVAVVSTEVPSGRSLKAGCYLVSPPRVGLDGRTLRQTADQRKIPVIVVVREPTSRDGLWPIVALGPVTIRTKVPPPLPPNGSQGKKGRKSSKKKSAPGAPGEPANQAPPPPPEWFLRANELLGDAGIASIEEDTSAAIRVEALLRRLEALPDHEKLHQALGDACRTALAEERARKPRKPARVPTPGADDDETEED